MLGNTLRCIGSGVKKTTPLLSKVRGKAAYEGDGKTTVRIINQESDMGIMIDAYATYGFRLNNGITVLGPMAIFPRTVFSWNVASTDDVTPESLVLFKMLEPRIDLLILGLECSDRARTARVLAAARKMNLNVELLTTEHAAATFNFLNAEGRSVAAALIPPLLIAPTDNDLLVSKMHYDNMYSKGMI